jgi:hypothetical protein
VENSVKSVENSFAPVEKLGKTVGKLSSPKIFNGLSQRSLILDISDHRWVQRGLDQVR